ncbi:MAG TPA: hypothetical protein VMP08_25695 [Anaerolineae bacterium]|nr:hypothetical protein [Anaerolineae bacterium]
MAQDMNTLTSRIVWTGALFILVFLSGLWLNRMGRPINTVVLTIHKLIALSTLILIGVTIYQVNQVVPLNATAWIVVVITGVLFVGTIVIGGLLSLEQPVMAVSLVHKISPFLTVASTIVSMYLLANPQP